jgi:hypothetical protein
VNHRRVALIFTLTIMVIMLALPFVTRADEPAPVPAAAAAPVVTDVPDPAGTATGTVKDITAKEAGKPVLAEIMDAVGHNKISINLVWTLITGYLVMFMQLGFALVETGFTRAKNASHTMLMNFMVYVIGMLGFWICGFAFMFGGVGQVAALGMNANLNSEVVLHLFGKDFGILGYKGFFLTGGAYDVAIFTLFLFQMVFMDTTATIPTGPWRSAGNFRLSVCMVCLSPCLSTPFMATGSGAGAGFPNSAPTSVWVMGRWISPAPGWCTWWAGSRLWPGP